MIIRASRLLFVLALLGGTVSAASAQSTGATSGGAAGSSPSGSSGTAGPSPSATAPSGGTATGKSATGPETSLDMEEMSKSKKDTQICKGC